MDIEYLRSKLEEETQITDKYSKLPDYFFEIAMLLLNKYGR